MAEQYLIHSGERLTNVQPSRPSNFQFTLTKIPTEGKYELSSAIIQNTTYNITSANCTVYISLNNTSYSTFTIPQGYYSSSTLLGNALQTALNTFNSGGSYVVTISATGIMSIGSGSNFKLCFASVVTVNNVDTPYIKNCRVQSGNLGQILGYGSIVTPFSTTLAATAPVNINWNLNFRIKITSGITSQGLSTYRQDYNFNIAIDSNYGSIQKYSPQGQTQMIHFGKGISNITIVVYDDTNTEVTFNTNSNWFFKLQQKF